MLKSMMNPIINNNNNNKINVCYGSNHSTDHVMWNVLFFIK